MKRVLYAVVGLIALVVLMAVVGLFLPKEHVAGHAAEFRAAPPAIYAIISDFATYPEWRTGVKKMDVTPDSGQGMVVTEDGPNGVIPYRVEKMQPDIIV